MAKNKLGTTLGFMTNKKNDASNNVVTPKDEDNIIEEVNFLKPEPFKTEALKYLAPVSNELKIAKRSDEPTILVDKKEQKDMDTNISHETSIIGNIESENNINIFGNVMGNITTTESVNIEGSVKGDVFGKNITIKNGTVEGNINSTAEVSMNEKSVVTGDVLCKTLDSDGKINGNVIASDNITMKNNAIAQGNMKTVSISVAKGSKINGNVEMHENSSN